MAVLRLFAGAREAAGTGRDELPGATVAAVLDAARARYGAAFGDLLEHCAIWCNGEPCEPDQPVGDADEVAVLPPVSGGAPDGDAAQAPARRQPASKERRGASGSLAGPGGGLARHAPPAAPAPLRGRLRHRRPPRPARDPVVPRWRRSPSSSVRSPPRSSTAAAAAVAAAQTAHVWRRRQQRPNRVVAAGHGRRDGPGRLPRRRRRGARRARRHRGRRRGGRRRRQVAQPRASPTPAGRSSARSRWGWRRCRWCCSPGSTRARPSRCSCWCRPTRPATTSSARAARNPYEGPVAASPPSRSSPSSCRRSASRPSTSARRGCSARPSPCSLRSASSSPARVLPAAGAPASGLRRLDSLLLAAPVWWLGVAAVT